MYIVSLFIKMPPSFLVAEQISAVWTIASKYGRHQSRRPQNGVL